VQRSFAGVEEYFAINSLTASVAGLMRGMSPADIEKIKARLTDKLPLPDFQGRVTTTAVANAVKGRLPK